jgi:hypothetical protein
MRGLRRELHFAEADITARVAALQVDLDRARAELARHSSDDDAWQASSRERTNGLVRMRGSVGAAAAASDTRRGARTSAKSLKHNGDQEGRRGS